MLARGGIKRVDKVCRFHLISGMPEHTFEWGGGLGMSCKSIWEYAILVVAGRN